MKRICLIFLEFAFLWSNVFSSEVDPVKPKDLDRDIPGAVTVLLKLEQLIENQVQPEVVEVVLCPGVLVQRNLVYVPNMHIAGFNASDIVVAERSTNRTYEVKNISRYHGTISNKLGWIHAHLQLLEEIDIPEVVPIIGPSDVLMNLCYVSQLWTHAELNPAVVNLARSGIFSVLQDNKCINNSVFTKVNKDPVIRVDFSSSGNGVEYASPLLCTTVGPKLVLVGHYAWGTPINGSIAYECSTGVNTTFSFPLIPIAKNPSLPGFVTRIVRSEYISQTVYEIV